MRDRGATVGGAPSCARLPISSRGCGDMRLCWGTCREHAVYPGFASFLRVHQWQRQLFCGWFYRPVSMQAHPNEDTREVQGGQTHGHYTRTLPRKGRRSSRPHDERARPAGTQYSSMVTLTPVKVLFPRQLDRLVYLCSCHEC